MMNNKTLNSSDDSSDEPMITAEVVIEALSDSDLSDLCDATEAAIIDGGGFGWINIPPRERLERFWKGVILVDNRDLFVGRHGNTIVATAQLNRKPSSNEAQSFSANLTTLFVTPWARGQGMGTLMLQAVEHHAYEQGIEVLNLDVRETQDAAIRLFERNGYEKWGTDPLYAKVNKTIIKGHYYQKSLAGKGDK